MASLLERMSVADLEEHRERLQRQIESLRNEFMLAGFELARKRNIGDLEKQHAELEEQIKEEKRKEAPESLLEAPEPAAQTVELKTLTLRGIAKLLGKGE